VKPSAVRRLPRTSARSLTIGQEIGRALRQLNPDERVVALAVSVDPEGDTPARVRRWLREQRVPANFHYLVGTRRELRPVWKSYYVASQPRHSHESRHTTSIWLIDGRGRLRTKFSAGVPVPSADIVHDLRLLTRERGAP
jgi:cytochrome oxidase Cu insertion factor (SCO1/SenC/PrrC family)